LILRVKSNLGYYRAQPKKINTFFFGVGPSRGERQYRCSPPAGRSMLDKLIRLCFMDVAISRRTHKDMHA
jgi:hypothetical protein